MNRQKFHELAAPHIIRAYEWHKIVSNEVPHLTDVPVFVSVYQTGTCLGENAYGEQVHHTIKSDNDVDGLYEFLEKEFPSITYLVGRRIERAIESVEYRDNEYYGSYTDYTGWYLAVDHLYDIMFGG